MIIELQETADYQGKQLTKKDATKSDKWIQYRALQLSRKAGITVVAAIEVITQEQKKADNKTADRSKAREQKKLRTQAQKKLRRKSKVDRKLVVALAKKERISIDYAYLVLRGQWSLEKAKKCPNKTKKSKGRIKMVGPGNSARSTDWSKVK